MTTQELRKILEEKRAELEALPLSERVRRHRETGIADLLSYGYLTEDEAKAYREQPTELPKDRKSLVVAYFLSGADGGAERSPKLFEMDAIKEVIAALHLKERNAFANGGTLKDVLSEEEQEAFMRWQRNTHTMGRIELAETFVDAKRKRIRAQLLRLFPPFMALELAEKKPRKGELDPIGSLRGGLAERGYRATAKSLNEKDREAIQEAAEYFLDLLELAYLNFEDEIREIEYLPYLNEDGSRWAREYRYKDETDEALLSYPDFYSLLDEAVTTAYRDGTAREAIEQLKESFRSLEEEGIFDKLRKSKFNVLIEEAKQC